MLKFHSQQFIGRSGGIRVNLLTSVLSSVLVLGLAFLTASQSYAQIQPYFEWEENYGGSAVDEALSVIQSADGGYVAVGRTMSSADGDVNGTNNGMADVWVVKLNADGDIEWEENYGGAGEDIAYSIAITLEGGYILAGSTASDSTGDMSQRNKGMTDVWLLKLDALGQIEWEINYGGTEDDVATSVTVSQDSCGFVVAGYTESSDTLDVDSVNNGGRDVWVLKVDTLGNLLWEDNFGGDQLDEARSVTTTADGGYIVAGFTESSDTLDVDSISNGGRDVWVLKLDSLGQLVWEDNFGGTGRDEAFSIDATIGGGFVVAGRTNSSSSGDVDSLNNGAGDAWILRLDANGVLVWEENYGGAAFDQANAVTSTIIGQIIVTGQTNSSMTGDVKGTNNGNADVWILGLDPNGQLQWEENYGGNRLDAGNAITQTFDGGVLVAGVTRSEMTGDLGRPTNGDRDVWALKFTPCDISISCPSDVTINCEEVPTPDLTGQPTVFSNLDFTVSFKDSIITSAKPGGVYTILREWSAINLCDSMATCIQMIDVLDIRGPVFQDCPMDTVVDLSMNQECDTIVSWVAPSMATDNCGFSDFLGVFHPSRWDTAYVGTGGGNNADTAWASSFDTLVFTGTTNGGSPWTTAQLCIDLPFDGTLSFSWETSNPGGISGERPNYRVFNPTSPTQFIGLGGANTVSAGRDTVSIVSTNRFCFGIPSNNDNVPSTLKIYDISFESAVFISQVSGPLSGVTNLGPGRYDVVYEAADMMGNTSRCSFEIQVWGATQMSCEDVNVSLDSQCMVIVTPRMFFTGDTLCVDSFEVEVTDAHGRPVNDTIGLDYLDQTLNYEVRDPGSGNSCWGTLTIEDKFAPRIICENDTMNCIEYTENLRFPTVIEFCQDYDTIVLDERIQDLGCTTAYSKRVNRKLIAVDASGNVSDTCFQEVYIEKFPIGDVQPPAVASRIYCGSGFDTTATGFPSPMATGRPFLIFNGKQGRQNIQLWPAPSFELCNISVTFEDHMLSGSGCTYQFLRTWRVRSFCDFNNPRVFQQTITVIDDRGPVINIGRDTMSEKAGRRSCDALVYMPKAAVSDVCNGVDRVDMVYPGGFSGNQNGGYIRLPVGVNKVIYRAYDDCYNESKDSVTVVVTDGVAPVAICDQNMVVTLDNDGVVSVEASAFDDGSFDECEMGSLQVARMDTACGIDGNVFGDFVNFCCQDVGREVMVRFKAIDKSGNENECMVRVTVQDKQAPRVTNGLPTLVLNCRFDWDPSNMDVFGKWVNDPADRDTIRLDSYLIRIIGQPLDGVVMDNCTPAVEEVVDSSNLDQCGTGYILRLFTFRDSFNNQTTWSQSIFFENPDTLTLADIDWPDHVDTTNVCGTDSVQPQFLPVHQAYPRFLNNDDECSLIGFSFKDELIDASQGDTACYKIIRKWTVIDWCQSVPDTTKKWFYDQVIEVSNTIAPTILMDSCLDRRIQRISDNCMGDTVEIIGRAIDDCTDSLRLFWRFKIDEGNDGTFDRIGQGNDATHFFPFGESRVKLFVEDLCGNQDSCDYVLTLENIKAPLAYCKPTVIAELTPVDTDSMGGFDDEQVEINARIFDSGSSQACDHTLYFSFSSNPADSVRIYNCDSISPMGTDTIKLVEIFVIDSVTGNFASCIDTLIIQDNNNVSICDTVTLVGTVSGFIQSDRKEMMKDVMVELAQSRGMMDMSDEQGAYTFDGVGLGGRYEIIPSKNDDHLNGVSTADLVLIQRHLLGKTPLATAYQYIAADVNNNSTVTAADIAELRRLILGITSELPNNTSWRFVDQGYQFPNWRNPWEEVFPETYPLAPFEQSMQVDFVGVKIGDINGDADVSGLGGINQPRGNMVVSARDRKYKAGDMVEMTMILGDLEEVAGYQFTIEWNTDELQFTDLVPNYGIGMDLGHFGMNRLDDGFITTSWHTTSSYHFPSAQQKRIVTLKFVALRDGRLSDDVHLSSAVTRKEAYIKGSTDPIDLVLEMDGGLQKGHFALYQNVPNPWAQSTVIAFHLPMEQEARLTFVDEAGRVIKVIEGYYPEGHNEVEIDKGNLMEGIYYYRLDTPEHSSTKKMVIMR